MVRALQPAAEGASDVKRTAVATCLFGALLALAPISARAELPSWLRIENGKVRDGNEKLAKGDAKGALADYDQAARELPDAPGVQLDRGLALMKTGDLSKAREALLSATQPSAPPALRADAYQNLALAFYREGDQLASQQKHKEAQQMFRESLDAGKRSLRLRPADPNVAWNLELAARRIREEEEKQKEEEQKQKDEQKDQEQKQDGSGDQSQDQNKDQDQQKQDEQKQDQKGEQKQDQGQDQDQKKPPEPKQDQAKPEDKGPDRGEQDEQSPQEQPADQPQPQLPQEAEQALDALSDSEENFERYRARQRANRERRAPEKDW
jgi:Ca-activated chloride channel family protein